jgi:hypothetical protein
VAAVRTVVRSDVGLRRLVVVAIAACSQPTGAPPSSSPAEMPQRTPRPLAIGESNIARADYIGPEACGACHAEQYADWAKSLHRVMNAQAEPKAVIGDFSGLTVRYQDGEVVLARDLAGYTMTTRDRERTTRYRVTRTIGRRGLQEYVGIEDGKRDEVRLPFGWWPRHGGWAAQPDFDPWLDEASFDANAPVREPWAERCPWCHSTYPFAQRIARAAGPRAVGHGFEQYVEAAGPPQVHDRLAVDEQVTTGISCESCHLGGRAHEGGAPIDFLPHGVTWRDGAPMFPTTFAEQREDARVVNGVCAQCHSGPSPRLSDGTALRNSSEALDLAASDCEAKCTDCHDPHRGGVDEARALAACARCHATQAQPAHAGRGHEPDARRAASRGHAVTTCLDCHMPRIVMGIDRYVRTHRISSPTNARLYAEAAPNACNLCHLDRTIAWTLAELRDGWDVAIGAAPRAYGDDNVGDVWLASSSPAVRLIAMHAYARSPLGTFARARIAKALADPEAYVRAWARFALDDIDKRNVRTRRD